MKITDQLMKPSDMFELCAETLFSGPMGLMLLSPILMMIATQGFEGAKFVINSAQFDIVVRSAYATQISTVLWAAKRLNCDSGEFVADDFIATLKEELARYCMRYYQERKDKLSAEMAKGATGERIEESLGGNVSSQERRSPPQIDFSSLIAQANQKPKGDAN